MNLSLKMASDGTMSNSTPPPILVTDYKEFQISMDMYPIHTFIFVIAGFIGNAFALMVILRKNLRHSSTAIFISILAVADSIALLGFLLGMISLMYVPHIITPDFCMAYYYILSTGSQISSWTIVAMTFERLILVVYPFIFNRLPEFNTTINMILVTVAEVVITVLLLLHNIHFFWTTSVDQTGCSYKHDVHKEFLRHWSVYDAFISVYIPLLLILIMNGIIIALICVNKSTVNRENDLMERKKWKKSNKVTVMLMSVSVAFFVLMTPYGIFQIYTYHILDLPTIPPKQLAQVSLANQFCSMFWEINHGINFLLYAVTRKKFRREIVNLFRDVKSFFTRVVCIKYKNENMYDFTQGNNTTVLTENSRAETMWSENATEINGNGIHIIT